MPGPPRPASPSCEKFARSNFPPFFFFFETEYIQSRPAKNKALFIRSDPTLLYRARKTPPWVIWQCSSKRGWPAQCAHVRARALSVGSSLPGSQRLPAPDSARWRRRTHRARAGRWLPRPLPQQREALHAAATVPRHVQGLRWPRWPLVRRESPPPPAPHNQKTTRRTLSFQDLACHRRAGPSTIVCGRTWFSCPTHVLPYVARTMWRAHARTRAHTTTTHHHHSHRRHC